MEKRFTTREEIRDYMKQHPTEIAKDFCGFESVEEFEGVANQPLQQFIDSYYEEGNCWDEFKGFTMEELKESVDDFAEYWI